MAKKENSKLPANKVFHSPYKSEIEKRLVMGQSVRAISKWLKLNGEEITHTTINEYKNKYFNFESEVGNVIKKKQQEITISNDSDDIEEIKEAQLSLIESEKNRAIGTIRSINHVSLLYDNLHDMKQYLMKLQNYEPVVAAHAAKGLYAEIRATIETLEKLAEKAEPEKETSMTRLLSGLKVKSKELEK